VLDNKPFSESCVQNRAPILQVIKALLAHNSNLLEVGSGTGQHAVYFAQELPHLTWHTSDVASNHPGIQLWLNEAQLANTRPPIELDVMHNEWPEVTIDAIFSANTVHIMGWPEVEHFFQGAGNLLPQGGVLLLYGPFNYNDQYTSHSNAQFDQWLKQRDPRSGIRDFEAVSRLAKAASLELHEDFEMPANNRILSWVKH